MTEISAASPSKRGGGWRGASAGPFPLITLILVIVIGLAAFVAATYLEVFDDGGGEPQTTGANAFSRSAIGHRAFVETLRRLDIPVQVSRFRTLDKIGNGGLLLVLEPETEEHSDGIVARMGAAPQALLVLPKWRGGTDRRKPIWIDRMDLLPESTPEDVLQELDKGAKIFRADGNVTDTVDRFGGRFELDHPQFILADGDGRIEPVISSAGRILLGALRAGGTQLWILSDPDLLSNAGIDEADNGVVAVSIVDALLPKGGTVIIDETAHGFEQRPNLLRTLLHPPFVTILLAAIAAMLVLVWAGATRFGAPLPETEGLSAGKLTLVKSASKLLRFGTSANNLLLSYRRLVLADAMAELHGPNGLDEFAQANWLDRAAAHRGLVIRVRPLLDQMSGLAESGRIDATRALRFALDLYRWKQEILHGTVTATPGRRRPTGGSVATGGTLRSR